MSGRIIINKILRFENIEYEWNKFILELKIKHVKLPHLLNSKYNHNEKFNLNKTTKERIYELYESDFKLLGYDK